MPLHPQVQAHLDRLADSNFADLHRFPHEQVREGMRLMSQSLGEGDSVARVEDRVIPTADGELPVRVYHPQPGTALPALVFFHGGGFVLGDLDTHDRLARAIASRARVVVVSVDYPRAPENRYPAAPEAAWAAVRWVSENAATIGANAGQLAVSGDSAGGNLAAGAALRARDAGGPTIALQVLIYPDLDFRRTTFSIREFAGKYGNVSRETQHWFMDHYLNRDEEKLESLVSPGLAENLADLPPALILTAEYDALRDEGEQYADRLRQAGVPVTLKRYDGMIHEFLRWPFDDAARALTDIADALTEAFAAATVM